MMKILAKAWGWTYLNMGLVLGLTYAVRIILARELSVIEFGMFWTAFAFASLLSGFRDLGLTEAVSFFVPRWREKKQVKKEGEGIGLIMMLQLGMSVILVVGSLAAWPWVKDLFFEGNEEGVKFLLPLLIWMGLLAFGSHVAWLHARQKWEWSSWSQTIFQGVLLGWIVMALKWSPENFAWGWPIGVVVMLLFFWPVVWKLGLRLRMPKKETTKEVVKYSLPLIVIAGGGMVIGNFNTLILAAFHGMRDVGLFNVAAPLAASLAAVAGAGIKVLGPIISEAGAKKDTVGVEKMLAIFYNGFLAGILPATIVAILWAPEILNLVFGEKYVEGYPVLQILLVAAVVQIFVSVNMIYVAFLKATSGLRAKLAIWTLAIHVLLVTPLTWEFGFVGLGLGMLLSQTATWVISSVILKKKMGMKFVSGNTVKILLVNLVWLVVLVEWGQKWVAGMGVLEGMVILGLGVVMVLGVEVWMKIFDLRAILGLVKMVRGK